ncbi:MAG: SufS family cysteine desulfurase [Thermoplasmata archaeon]|nr:SufS family cysteine desulfurase [Thermoplasmata archaeon]
MDVARIRDDFPILSREFRGKKLVYLDSAATSQKPTKVIDAEADFYRRQNANVHRGVYSLSEEATDAYEHARERVASFLNAYDSSEVVFVRGATEGLNLIASSMVEGLLQKGDRVVTTVMEHHSNIVPWQIAKSRGKIELAFIDIDDQGHLRLGDYGSLLGRPTKVVTLTHVSNVLGTINPVREIADRAHELGAYVVLDAAQSVPHVKVDVRALGVDFVTFSGHKVLGPMGIGAVWGRRELMDRLPPYMGGGEMIQEVHRDRVEFRGTPARFEAGTPNVAGAIALQSALDYFENIGWADLESHEEALVRHFFRQAEDRFDGRLRVYGPGRGEPRAPVFSFSLAGAHPHDVASLLDTEAVAVRAGHHCAQPLMERLGVPALTRASPYIYNDIADLDRCFDALTRVEKVFARPASPPKAA